MEAVTQEQAIRNPQGIQAGGLAISYEWIAYGLLLVLAVWLRVAELDTVPLASAEATQALATWRALHPALPGAAIVPESPLLFALHGLSFSTLGASEFSARIFTALAGAFLVVAPALFREVLGWSRAYLFSLILRHYSVISWVFL